MLVTNKVCQCRWVHKVRGRSSVLFPVYRSDIRMTTGHILCTYSPRNPEGKLQPNPDLWNQAERRLLAPQLSVALLWSPDGQGLPAPPGAETGEASGCGSGSTCSSPSSAALKREQQSQAKPEIYFKCANRMVGTCLVAHGMFKYSEWWFTCRDLTGAHFPTRFFRNLAFS